MLLKYFVQLGTINSWSKKIKLNWRIIVQRGLLNGEMGRHNLQFTRCKSNPKSQYWYSNFSFEIQKCELKNICYKCQFKSFNLWVTSSNSQIEVSDPL